MRFRAMALAISFHRFEKEIFSMNLRAVCRPGHSREFDDHFLRQFT